MSYGLYRLISHLADKACALRPVSVNDSANILLIAYDPTGPRGPLAFAPARRRGGRGAKPRRNRVVGVKTGTYPVRPHRLNALIFLRRSAFRGPSRHHPYPPERPTRAHRPSARYRHSDIGHPLPRQNNLLALLLFAKCKNLCKLQIRLCKLEKTRGHDAIPRLRRGRRASPSACAGWGRSARSAPSEACPRP